MVCGAMSSGVAMYVVELSANKKGKCIVSKYISSFIDSVAKGIMSIFYMIHSTIPCCRSVPVMSCPYSRFMQTLSIP
jgi:hypothetical protein